MLLEDCKLQSDALVDKEVKTMKDTNKTLLNEGTVRRFMALAGVESLVNPFLKKVNEEAKLQTEIEANLGAASDAKLGGELPPPTAPEVPPPPPPEDTTPVGKAPEEGQPTMEEELLHEEIPEVDISDTSEWDPATGKTTNPGAVGGGTTASPVIGGKTLGADLSKARKVGLKSFERGGTEFAVQSPEARKAMQARKKAAGIQENTQRHEALTSRTLAESILRHIPNLEIINDEPSLKTRRQSDILSEVTKRVKQLLSK